MALPGGLVNAHVIPLNECSLMNKRDGDRARAETSAAAPRLKFGLLVAFTLFGAWIGYAQAGRISDGPTQSRWIAQGAFWGSLLCGIGGAFLALCISRFKIRLTFLLEFIVVAALISMFMSNLLYWNNVSRERSIRMEKMVEELEAQLKLESNGTPNPTR
jgi:MFS family permease